MLMRAVMLPAHLVGGRRRAEQSQTPTGVEIPSQMTPRSKFYTIKMHWFQSWLKPNKIELQYISTKLQKADMFTKSLTVADFENNRRLTMGW